MAMAIFPKRPLREALVHVAGLQGDPMAVDEGLTQLHRLSLVRQRGGRHAMLPLTREYALAELGARPEFECEARQRWVEWYLDFTERYGDRDWHEYQIRYDRIEEEWENILAVLDWCAMNDRYAEVVAFWMPERVNDFTNTYGYWDDRVIWLDWLFCEAERRGDWPVALEFMCDMGWTLIMMGQEECLDQGSQLLVRAWSLREQAKPGLQYELSHNIAVLHVRKKEYSKAHRWLDLSRELLADLQVAQREFVRYDIGNRYWKAAISYEAGEFCQAKELFCEVRDLGESIKWQRAVIYALNWLADIAIEQDDLNQAERLLQEGLPIAERNRDRRRTAFYKYSFARLERARGELVASRQWAEEALDGFDRLGMQPEVDEVRHLLAEVGE
jgi:LuxR family glucitol operon transcriptional activator